jgi:Ca2+-binding RTX toxin-like protein
LILANGTNSAVVANTETILGGTGADSISIVSPAVGACIDLGAGNDLVVLGNFTNSATISNVETIIGGSGADTIKLGTALVNGSVDLGAGNDTLRLTNFTSWVSVANTETVLGGAGNDRIVLTGSNASLVVGGAGMNFITGNTGADQFVLDQNGAGNVSTITNFNAAKGDRIALDTTAGATLSGNTYDLGAGGLVAGTNLKAAADAAARLVIAETTGGKGGFVYQQDTGELYYSGNGNFAGGGTMVGAIDASGGTPWLYNASSFVQV